MKPEAGLWRPRRGRLHVRLPYSWDNRRWLRGLCGERTRPVWDKAKKRWLVARPHLRVLAEGLAERYGSCLVVLDVSTRTVCTSVCRDAGSDECGCSCLGRNHGGSAYMLSWVDLGGVQLGFERVRLRYRVDAGVTQGNVTSPFSYKRTAASPASNPLRQ